MTNELLNKSLTGTNAKAISDTDGEVSTNAYAIQAVTDLTFTTLSGPFQGSARLVTSGMTAGQLLYIPIHTIELSSGTAVLYRHNTNS